MILPASLLGILAPLNAFFYNKTPLPSSSSAILNGQHLNLELRHVHAVSDSNRIVFSDASTSPSFAQSNTMYSLDTRRLSSHRPSSFEEHSEARVRSMKFGQSTSIPWEEIDVIGPNVEKRETLLTLAKMTNDAYVVDRNDTQWYDLGKGWPSVRTFRSTFLAPH